MAVKYSWRSEDGKCPACHQPGEHEIGCFYEGLSLREAYVQHFLDPPRDEADTGPLPPPADPPSHGQKA